MKDILLEILSTNLSLTLKDFFLMIFSDFQKDFKNKNRKKNKCLLEKKCLIYIKYVSESPWFLGGPSLQTQMPNQGQQQEKTRRTRRGPRKGLMKELP